jgi:hypothetical protein
MSALSFLINYIFNSTIRKKLKKDKNNNYKFINDLLTEQKFKALTITNNDYCINDFLF